MARGTALPTIEGAIRADCGCVADVIDSRTTGSCPTVTAKVTVPCTDGHPVIGGVERVTPGVIIHRDPHTITVLGATS